MVRCFLKYTPRYGERGYTIQQNSSTSTRNNPPDEIQTKTLESAAVFTYVLIRPSWIESRVHMWLDDKPRKLEKDERQNLSKITFL